MKINRENYEAYFIDYLDGSLSPRELDELKAFLLINDDLADLLEDINTTRLNIPAITYPHKQKLHRDIIHEYPDYYAIAIAEKAITKEDESFLRRHLQEKELREQAMIYKELRLIPDTTLYYPHKHKLFRKKNIKSYIYFSIAAVLLLFIGFRVLMPEAPADVYIITSDNSILNSIKEDFNTNHINQYDDIKDTIHYRSEIKKDNNAKVKQATPIEKIPILSVISLPENKLGVENSTDASYLKIPVDLQTLSPEIILYACAEKWETPTNNSNTTNIVSSMLDVGKNLAKRIKNRQEKENVSNNTILQFVIW